jgi:hypothetical protein
MLEMPSTNHLELITSPTVLFRPSLRHASRSIFLDLGFMRLSPIGEGEVAKKFQFSKTDEELVEKRQYLRAKLIPSDSRSPREAWGVRDLLMIVADALKPTLPTLVLCLDTRILSGIDSRRRSACISQTISTTQV